MVATGTDRQRSFTLLRWLLVVNVALFLTLRGIAALLPQSARMFGMFELPGSFDAMICHPWSVLTYMFVHYDALHVSVNMLCLWLFGSIAVGRGSGGRMAAVYVAGGVVGGLMFIVADMLTGSSYSLLGSSAAVLAVVVAVALLYPRQTFALPILGCVQLRWVALMVVCVMLMSVDGSTLCAFMSHIGGVLTGLIAGLLGRKERRQYGVGAVGGAVSASLPDALLAKLRRSGYASLTDDERRMLVETSRKE